MKQDQQRRSIAGIDTTLYDSGERAGQTRAVVMVHGGDPRSLANALDWSTIWDPSAIGARLVAYDKPGQGLTYSRSMDAATMSADALSAHLEALVDSLGARVTLMGHSRGALPVADVALRRPELVDSVVLVASNTLAPNSDRTPAGFYPTAYANRPATPTDAYVRKEPDMNSFSTRHVDERFIVGRRSAALQNGWWDDAASRTRIYDEVALPTLAAMKTRVLAGIASEGFEMPVLQVWGQNDVSAPVILAHELFASIAAKTPIATSAILNQSAHYVYREHPARFISIVAAFLAQSE